MKNITPSPCPCEFHIWEHYARELMVEYQQCVEEGLDCEKYKSLFESVNQMPHSQYKEEMADIISRLVLNMDMRADYEYDEPSELEEIKAKRNLDLLKPCTGTAVPLEKKIQGAWYGRIIGCLLGKPVECAWTSAIHAVLKSSDNLPMHRYIKASDLKMDVLEANDAMWLKDRNSYPDIIECAPFDDDTNYTVMAQCMLDDYGDTFTPRDVLETWVKYQGRNAYCSAERVAYINYMKHFMPPQTATYQNPYREWIGAQIRGDYYGYITKNPEKAAELAWRDASISHIKNGIYGEMLISAMLAGAHTNSNILDVIYIGLSQIPQKSRLYAQAIELIDDYKNGVKKDEAFKKIHTIYNYKSSHDWCHTISNALIVIASLLYGNGDFGKSICMAVETGFDTDCNGATVGSILGMINGIDSISEEWKAPLKGMLQTQILGHEKVKIDELVKKTLIHIEKFDK
ncbi:MAG: ADP-ribosylglycohydrolase family protein [Clostridia bacterium]|nr:ADP-ribosylglycohydrolase family protein [Clostridia bacterium]MBO5092026.1 ADP-ribosylglycohydrolase family protein [Clostridia bacterium]MBP3494658.1 ADP-ribosylglycohydrolase family protein [Clostridia bacterium]MBQ7788538.1 ADP-ribosylglycohydrolase family protein [Clostridia bacterium]